MLPLSLLKTSMGHSMLVELKNGETYNGVLNACDALMNVHLSKVVCTNKDGDRFHEIETCFIRGNTIKYMCIQEEIIQLAKEENERRAQERGPYQHGGRGEGGRGGEGGGGRGRGGGRGDGGRGRGGDGGRGRGGRGDYGRGRGRGRGGGD